MKNTLTTAILLIIATTLSAQTITNIQARQEGLEIIITYDMNGELKTDDEIVLGVSTDGGKNYLKLTDAEGDIGSNVKPGTGKTIYWLVSAAMGGKDAVFNVGTMKDFAPPDMVYVQGGTFQMGSNDGDDDEKPVHTVTVSSFFMDATEVTQAQYRKVMGINPSNFSGCDDCPVENVSWNDANEYAKKVGKRLPTEAEWEYAAQGGNQSQGYAYAGTIDIDKVAWNNEFYKKSIPSCMFGSVYFWYSVHDNKNINYLDITVACAIIYNIISSIKTHPVGQKKPNELGLYDMSGNVWEWCSDWYGDYSSAAQTNPRGPNDGSFRVLRGGSWNDDVIDCRVANRNRYNPNYRYNLNGFRCVRDFEK